MGTIKDRNGKDLTEAEETKKRWQNKKKKGKIYSMECGVPETRKERQESLRSEKASPPCSLFLTHRIHLQSNRALEGKSDN